MRVAPHGRFDYDKDQVTSSRSLLFCALLALLPVVVLTACESAPVPRAAAKGPSRKALPACAHGTFAGELEAHMPPLAPVVAVALFSPQGLDPAIEPGCVVPFRDRPGQDAMKDVGRVLIWQMERNPAKPGKPRLVGRGRLQIGRASMRLAAVNDAGDEVLFLEVAGRHVTMRSKGGPPFDADVDLAAETPLPLPLDALVASLDHCDKDERLSASANGNVVEAKRGSFALWRSRWLEAGGGAVVDTSVLCGENDARLAWRTAVGELLPMLSLASVRARDSLIIAAEPGAWTEDVER